MAEIQERRHVWVVLVQDNPWINNNPEWEVTCAYDTEEKAKAAMWGIHHAEGSRVATCWKVEVL